jgi:hypothetical protein
MADPRRSRADDTQLTQAAGAKAGGGGGEQETIGAETSPSAGPRPEAL